MVERCIIDKIAVIGHNAHVGAIPQMGELGITCIGKNAHIPAGYTVGHGSILGTDLRMEDFEQFADKIVPNGTKLGYTSKKR